ncbi:MAG: PAS domain S-box protein [Comamonadaceae bacterium]|nr:PAS domain S-box protein [Comamonadaceae bacterium]
MFGYQFSELKGIKFHTLLAPPHRRAAAKTGFSDFKQTGEGTVMGKRFETSAVHRSGEEFPIELSVFGVRLGDDWHGIGIVRDITRQRIVETELRIAATASNAQMGMTFTDAQNVILRVNKAFTEITGYSALEVVGQTPHLLSSGRHDNQFYQTMYRNIAESGMWAGEIWNRHKNGEVFPESMPLLLDRCVH